MFGISVQDRVKGHLRNRWQQPHSFPFTQNKHQQPITSQFFRTKYPHQFKMRSAFSTPAALPASEMQTLSRRNSAKRSSVASPVPEALAAPLCSFLARPSVIIAVHSLLSLASVDELRHIEVLRSRRDYSSLAHSRRGSSLSLPLPLSRASHVNCGDALCPKGHGASHTAGKCGRLKPST